MRKIFFINVCFLILFQWGCTRGHISTGITGGSVVNKDTARLETVASYENAWFVTANVIRTMGEIDLKGKKMGRIEALVNSSNITIQMQQIVPDKVRIDVKSRKNFLPNLDLAIDIINRIDSGLDQLDE